MKKILVLLVLLVIYIPVIFGESDVLINNQDNFIIKVLGEVKSENYVASVYYDGEKLIEDLTVIDNDNFRFDISKPGRTKEFRIVIEGNQKKSKNLQIKIQGQQFVGALGTQTQNIITNLYVNAVASNNITENIPNTNIPYLTSLYIPEGAHSLEENVVETRFVLAWKGNENLPAGFYSSDIDIEYSLID